MKDPVNVLDLTPDEFRGFLKSLGEPSSGSDRILRTIYRGCPAGLREMSGLETTLTSKLAETARLGTMEQLQEMVSADGQTVKVLFRLEDGKTVESSLMRSRNSRTGRERRTVCLSSQVGCSVGCHFCATGQQGFERNLRPGEIVEQALHFVRRYRDSESSTGSRKPSNWLTNVVFMGMGEPLANYDNVRQTIAAFNSLMGLGYHQVTLSTAGLVPQIQRLTDENIQFELAVSLHAATDELRNRLVPINRKYPLGQLVPVCRDYAQRTGRKVFIEYALFAGVNDSLDDAEALTALLEGLDCRINLILGNPTRSGDFRPSGTAQAIAFRNRLMAAGNRAMIRVSRGADIEAGCGQLRSRWLNANEH